MNAPDLIAALQETREKQAGDGGFNPRRIGERMRQRQRERTANGARYVSFLRTDGAAERAQKEAQP